MIFYLIIFIFCSPLIFGHFYGSWIFAKYLFNVKFIIIKYLASQLLLFMVLLSVLFWYNKNEKRELQIKQFAYMEKVIGFKIPQPYKVKNYVYFDDNWQDFNIEFELKLNGTSYYKIERLIQNKQFSKEIEGKWIKSECGFTFEGTKNNNGKIVNAFINKKSHILKFELIQI